MKRTVSYYGRKKIQDEDIDGELRIYELNEEEKKMRRAGE